MNRDEVNVHIFFVLHFFFQTNVKLLCNPCSYLQQTISTLMYHNDSMKNIEDEECEYY